MPAMAGLLCVEFSADEFEFYCRETLPKLMQAWRPRGVVLHNTGAMAWPGQDPHTHQPLTPKQRIENMSVTWVNAGFHGGPHFLITPKPSIITMWPAWQPGTHSPSWNSTFWGMEMVGDFDLEPFPDGMRDTAARALRALYAMLGHEATADSFHLHKEDPRTTHKRCPGVNCGDKAAWLSRLNAITAPIAMLDLPHAHAVPTGANEFIRAREGLVLKAYQDNLVFSMGYGTHIKPDGTAVQEGETCTEAQAAAWQAARTQSDWDHLQQMVKVPISDGQATALLSWCYEFNVGRLESSTMLQRLNARDYAGAAASLMTWDKIHDAGGSLIESPGLKKRRMMEVALWNGLDPHATTAAPANPPTKPLPVVNPGPKTTAGPALPLAPVPAHVSAAPAAPLPGTAPFAPRMPAAPVRAPVGFEERFIAWLEDVVLKAESKTAAAGGSR